MNKEQRSDQDHVDGIRSRIDREAFHMARRFFGERRTSSAGSHAEDLAWAFMNGMAMENEAADIQHEIILSQRRLAYSLHFAGRVCVWCNGPCKQTCTGAFNAGLR